MIDILHTLYIAFIHIFFNTIYIYEEPNIDKNDLPIIKEYTMQSQHVLDELDLITKYYKVVENRIITINEILNNKYIRTNIIDIQKLRQ